MEKIIEKAAVLIEALPYIQSFQKKIVVVKLGGSAMTSPDCVEGVLRDVVFMEAVKMKPVVVHGGGDAISLRMKEAGIVPRFREGLRVTDPGTIGIVEEVLSEINGRLKDQIEELGGRAESLSTRDDNVIKARKHMPLLPGPAGSSRTADIGFVGEVERIDAAAITRITRRDRVPVIAPLGRDEEGQVYNINGDLAAGAIAAALKAEKLVFLTDVEGIMTKSDQPGQQQLLSTLTGEEIIQLLDEGVIAGGMIPKVKAGLHALEGGVKKIHIIDGRVKHSLLLEIFTDKGIGTEIVG
ncbi:MAG: acetylglutamate kinase [Candidatus Euphemobacter frigidus]|nr:acetylglutamate kinase [Candidatus Euphemobacter frigidus]MDP8274868.1 acetylglutamate kinase [Candidatus Euphemobacter frigidus]